MTRKPDDWMPLHIGAYLADTTHLTRDQHGAYLLLLMAYWRKGEALPADDGQLAAMAKATPAEWRKMRPIIGALFTEEGGRWYQKRCEEELEKARGKMAAKSEAGRAGAQSRWQKNASANGKHDGKRIADASVSHRQTDAPITKYQVPSSLREDSGSLDLLGEGSASKPKFTEPEGFSAFYEAFPLKKARPKAAEAYARAIKRAMPGTILAAARRYAEARKGEEPKFTAHPATWLNQERWNDDVPAQASDGAAATVNSGHIQKPGEDQDHFLVRRFKETGHWSGMYGPPPTDPHCEITEKILIEFGYREKVSRETKAA